MASRRRSNPSNSFSDSEDAVNASPRGSKGGIKTEADKARHNEVSQAGRERINALVSMIKVLLPETRNVDCNKAAVLATAVSAIKKYEKAINEYQDQLMKIKAENNYIREALDPNFTEGASDHSWNSSMTEQFVAQNQSQFIQHKMESSEASNAYLQGFSEESDYNDSHSLQDTQNFELPTNNSTMYSDLAANFFPQAPSPYNFQSREMSALLENLAVNNKAPVALAQSEYPSNEEKEDFLFIKNEAFDDYQQDSSPESTGDCNDGDWGDQEFNLF